MKDICVITGGSSGMGLSAAKYVGSDYHLILIGRTESKLAKAKKELEALGLEVESVVCDISDRSSVQALAKRAAATGTVKAVIHSAGVSPDTDNSAERIFVIDAVGTVHVNEEFAAVMDQDGCIIDVASMAAYMVPEDKTPKDLYKLALSDLEQFREQAMTMLTALPDDIATGYSYSVAKNFVIWYARQSALRYGHQGLRVLSVSPGSFTTPMGLAGGERTAAFARRGALGRMGEPDEIGRLLAFLAVGGADYLTATDILCDGGTIAAIQA
jgi:NAD(P)-dependent dehydrogenase (short-subunit alcohol dehydrogenase family)